MPPTRAAQVLSSAGDAWLGGDDFDVAIARHLATTQMDTRPAGAPRIDERSAELRSVARHLKERLTVSRAAEASLPPWAGTAEAERPAADADGSAVGGGSGVADEADASDASQSRVSLDRASLETVCSDLLAAMREPVVRACDQAQVALPGAAGGGAGRAASMKAGRVLARPSSKGAKIDAVLRVGAASRMPAVCGCRRRRTACLHSPARRRAHAHAHADAFTRPRADVYTRACDVAVSAGGGDARGACWYQVPRQHCTA